MIELANHAILLLRYEGVDYPVCGYFMPSAVLRRSEVTSNVLLEYDTKEGILLQSGVHRKLKEIYDSVILPADIKALAKIDEEKPARPNFIDITRMFR